jgi:arsenate reductase
MKTILFYFVLACVLTFIGCDEQKSSDQSNKLSETSSTPTITMFTEIATYIQSEIVPALENIPEQRKVELAKIADYISSSRKANEVANLNFNCTHNSRRSHLSQIWAQTAATYYGLTDYVLSFSGGTEATAFNSRAVAAIQRVGFKVQNPGGVNPRYAVSFAPNIAPMICYSKVFDNQEEELTDFVAVMTCSEADQNCPFIPNASLRVAIPYEDPKEADGTDFEQQRYDERTKQIATEMFYLMSLVK